MVSNGLRSLVLLLAACVFGLPAWAGKVYLTVPEALALAFPECKVERETFYLSAEDVKKASKLAKSEVDVRIVRPYVARQKGVIVGYAYFDTHRVRTKKETLMIVVDPQQRLGRIEVLAFGEPDEYVPRGAFWAQYKGRRLDDDLALRRGVRGVSGATLTVRAVTDASRRVLALHQAVHGEPQPLPVPVEEISDAKRERKTR